MSKSLTRLLTFCLCAVMVLGMFTACGGEETPSAVTPTEPAEEATVLKVLTLGHSLSVDSCHMINLVCGAEGVGDYDEIVIGTLYYSGCKLTQHVEFMTTNAPEYRLYLSSSKTPEKPPETMESVTMQDALRYDYWDIIVMQGNPWE